MDPKSTSSLEAEQAEAVSFIEKMSDRGCLPLSPRWDWWFSDTVEFGGDFAQRKAGIGNGDRSNQQHWAVFWSAFR